MAEYIDVKIDVFEHSDQRARVLESLTPTGLIQEILKEFDDITADLPEKYAIYLKGMERPLNANYTMAQLDIQPQDELVFDYVRKTIRQMLHPSQYAILREDTTGKSFDIQWQPAVIGRPTNEVDHDIVLAVNVQLVPNGMTISRKHAQITFSDGKYYIEMMAENNLLILNGKEMVLNSRKEIRNGDKIIVGRNKVPFTFIAQQVAKPAAHEPRSQPIPHVRLPTDALAASHGSIRTTAALRACREFRWNFHWDGRIGGFLSGDRTGNRQGTGRAAHRHPCLPLHTRAHHPHPERGTGGLAPSCRSQL